jgi:hypothetical protein
VGAEQAWIIWQLAVLPGPRLALAFPPAYFGFGRSIHLWAQGWGVKGMWIMEPEHPQLVYVRATELATGAPLTFTDERSGSTTTALALDPALSLTGDASLPTSQEAHYLTFPGGVYIPHAGCYSLLVTWSTGSWQMNFSFGTTSAGGSF